VVSLFKEETFARSLQVIATTCGFTGKVPSTLGLISWVGEVFTVDNLLKR
jgi:hypothetical protein